MLGKKDRVKYKTRVPGEVTRDGSHTIIVGQIHQCPVYTTKKVTQGEPGFNLGRVNPRRVFVV